MPLSTLLKFTYLLSLVYFAHAAIHRVNHDDSAISYIPSVCNLDCTRVCQEEWWLSCLSGGQSSHRTKGNNTQASFTFRGSSITWYTRTANNGGKAVVYIDGKDPEYFDTNSAVVNEANPLFTRSGLDPTVSHTISVLFDTSSFQSDRLLERFVDVRYFDYDDGADALGAAQSNTQTTTRSSSSSTSSTSSGSTPANSSATSGSTTLNSTATSGASGTLNPAFATLGGNGGATQTSGSSDGDIASISNPDGSSSQHMSLAAIIGAAFGGLAGGLIIFFIIFWLRKERAHRRVVIAPEQKEAQEDNASTRSTNEGGNNAATLPNLSNNNSTAKFIEAHRYSHPDAHRRFRISAYHGIAGLGNTNREREREREHERERERAHHQPETRTDRSPDSPPPSATGSLDTFDMMSPFSLPSGSGAGSLGLSLYPPPPGPYESEDSTTDPSFMTPPPRYIQ